MTIPVSPQRRYGRTRRFVLDCLLHIVPDWRDPVTGRTIRQLTYRARAVDRGRARP